MKKLTQYLMAFPIDREDGRKRHLTTMLLAAGIVTDLVLLVQDLLVWNPFELVIDLAILFLFIVYLFGLGRVKNADLLYRLSVGTLAVGLVLVAYRHPEVQSKILLLLIFPQIFHIILGNREGLVWTILLLGAVLVLMVIRYNQGLVQSMEFIFKYLAAYISISLIAYTQEWIRGLYYDKLTREKEQLSRANLEIQTISITDNLTGLYNRRYLDDHLAKIFREAKGSEQPLALVLGDIDHFKSVNDRYGHQTGDRVLQRVSEIMTGALRRENDWISRYGGEEFLIVMPNTLLSTAVEVAERIRRRIQECPVSSGAHSIGVTISFGVSAIPGPWDVPDHDALVTMADKALYRAKQTGRNRVVSFETI